MEQCKIWLEFVGEGRSGHTVVASILDAHPNIRISEEKKWVGRWYRNAGDTKEDIMSGVVSCTGGRERNKYLISGSHQLTHTPPLLVAGDKCGWAAVNEVKRRGAPKDIIGRFADFMEMDYRVIHTVRNPFDNIASWCVSPKYIRRFPSDYGRLRQMIRRYSRFCTTVCEMTETMEKEKIYTLYNEDLIERPQETISNLLEFLSVPYTAEQVGLFSSVVLDRPTAKSNSMEFLGDCHEMVYWRIIDKYPFLSKYRRGHEA